MNRPARMLLDDRMTVKLDRLRLNIHTLDRLLYPPEVKTENCNRLSWKKLVNRAIDYANLYLADRIRERRKATGWYEDQRRQKEIDALELRMRRKPAQLELPGGPQR